MRLDIHGTEIKLRFIESLLEDRTLTVLSWYIGILLEVQSKIENLDELILCVGLQNPFDPKPLTTVRIQLKQQGNTPKLLLITLFPSVCEWHL